VIDHPGLTITAHNHFESLSAGQKTFDIFQHRLNVAFTPAELVNVLLDLVDKNQMRRRSIHAPGHHRTSFASASRRS
jgi:hypothetical protein